MHGKRNMLGAMLLAAATAVTIGAVSAAPRAAWAQTVAPAGDAAPAASATAASAPAPAPVPPRDPLVILKDPASAPGEREEAARRLRYGPPEARQALLGVLNDSTNRTAQLAAAKTLSLDPNPDPAYLQPLVVLAKSDRPNWADAAIKALSRYHGNGDVRNFLIDVARDPQRQQKEFARVSAIGSLATIPDKSAAATLVDLVGSEAESGAIRNAAADALGDLTGAAEPHRDPNEWRQWWAANRDKPDDVFERDLLAARSAKLAREELRSERLADAMQTNLIAGYQAATEKNNKEKLLLGYLRSDEPKVRAVGARLVHDDFTQNNPIPPSVKQQLREMIGDSSASVRVLVARALFDLNDATALDALLNQLAQETNPDVRLELVNALVPIRDVRVVKALLNLLDDESLSVAETAARGLAELGQQMQIRQRDPALAQRIADKLRKTLDERTGKPGTLNFRAALIDAMAPLRDPQLRGIFNRLLHPRESIVVRRAAIRALGDYGDPSAAESIANSNALEDNDDGMRLEALGALEKTATITQAELLWKVLKEDRNPAVRDRAWQVLRLVFDSDTDVPKEALNRWADRFKDEPERRVEILKALAKRLTAEKDLAQLAAVQQNIGADLMKLNRPEEADRYFDLALQYYRNRNPNDQDMITGVLVEQRMDALLASRQYDSAAGFAAGSIALNAGNQETVGRKIRNEADRLRNDGKFTEALQLIDAAKRMSPKLAEPFASVLRGIEQDIREKQKGPRSAVGSGQGG